MLLHVQQAAGVAVAVGLGGGKHSARLGTPTYLWTLFWYRNTAVLAFVCCDGFSCRIMVWTISIEDVKKLAQEVMVYVAGQGQHDAALPYGATAVCCRIAGETQGITKQYTGFTSFHPT